LNIKHEIEKKPEFSGSSAQVLADLQADNRSRTPSTIIERQPEKQIETLRATLANPSTPESVKPSIEAAIGKINRRARRAAQTLASSRMSAKVALDKLEARLADAAANHSKYYLEINGKSFKLVEGASGYRVYQDDTRLGIIKPNDDGHWVAQVGHQRLREVVFANAPAAVVQLYAIYVGRSHHLGIPRGIKAFRWSGVEAHGEIAQVV